MINKLIFILSDVYVNSKKDISVGYFHGDKLHLNSSEGNIFIDKFQGTSVNLKTDIGNIHLKEFIQASTITAEILHSGVSTRYYLLLCLY